MAKFIRQYAPLLLALLLLLLTTVIVLSVSMSYNDGHVVYSLDDPYIHMAMAKNLAIYGTWGVNRHEFTSSSSSLLWTLLLSGVYAVFGVNDLAPLILNVLFLSVLLAFVFYILRSSGSGAVLNGFFLFILTLGIPSVALVFCGMEHSLHTALSVIFAYGSAQVISRNSTCTPVRELSMLLVFAALVVMARFEGVFLVAVVCLLLVLRRRWMLSALLGVCGAFPVVLFGMISVVKGWYFFPNSIMAKANVPRSLSLANLLGLGNSSNTTSLFERLYLSAPSLTVLLLFAVGGLVVLGRTSAKVWNPVSTLLVIFVLTTLIHLQFADTGWFFRYEAYLVALGIFAIALAVLRLRQSSGLFWQRGPALIGMVILVGVMVTPLLARGAGASIHAPVFSRDIFHQQVQMGLFLKEYYSEAGVAANDIGAINYYSDIDCLDLWGLADLDTFRAKWIGEYPPHLRFELAEARGVKIAIIFDKWFERYGGSPVQWYKVAEWTDKDNVASVSKTVSFYAVDPSERSRLAQSIRLFSSNRLPEKVVW